MKIGIMSNCTIDTIKISDNEFERPGGPVLYGGLTAKNLKFDVCLFTKFGKDFPQDVISKHNLNIQNLSEKPTTRFLITITGSDRTLHLINKCESIEYSKSDIEGCIISPVFDEISLNALDKIKSDVNFSLIDPQGFLRRTNEKNEIFLENTELDLSNITALKANPREMINLVGQSGDESLKLVQRRGVEYVLLTDKQKISLLAKDRVYTIFLPNVEVNDTTGIGDIFCAAFCCTMIKERDFLWAISFAGGAAQAALESKGIGLDKVPQKGAIETNASYFYNTVKFRQI